LHKTKSARIIISDDGLIFEVKHHMIMSRQAGSIMVKLSCYLAANAE
jgi:hypothetical protein